MSAADTPTLTKRQRDVLERIDKRLPIKVIAGDLGVSEARINQHIRALKDKFGVESMSELVERFRTLDGPENQEKTESPSAEGQAETSPETPIEILYTENLSCRTRRKSIISILGSTPERSFFLMHITSSSMRLGLNPGNRWLSHLN